MRKPYVDEHPSLQNACVTTSTSEVSTVQTFKADPNPTLGWIQLKDLPAGTKKITVIGIDGSIIRQEMCDTNEFQLDIQNHESGMYLINVSSDAYSKTQKIIKL